MDTSTSGAPYMELSYYKNLLDMHAAAYRRTFSEAHLHRYWVLYNYVRPWFSSAMPPIPDDLMAVILLENWSEEDKPK